MNKGHREETERLRKKIEAQASKLEVAKKALRHFAAHAGLETGLRQMARDTLYQLGDEHGTVAT